MSNARYLRTEELLLDVGPGFCRRCGVALTGRRTSWCSAACSAWFSFMGSTSAQRASVERRDRGVCSRCGLDTDALWWSFEQPVREIDQRLRDLELALFPSRLRTRAESQARIAAFDVAKREALRLKNEMVERWNAVVDLHGVPQPPFPRRTAPRSLWEADHIKPVVEGGGVTRQSTIEEVLANLRTLCVPCHKRQTSALAARRAAARRPQRLLFADHAPQEAARA